MAIIITKGIVLFYTFNITKKINAMKTTSIYCLFSIVLFTFSCKKSTLNPDGINIKKAIDSGVLFSTWIINDDDVAQQKQTQQSDMFTNIGKPLLSFDKNKTYLLSYKDLTTNKPVTESGTWDTNNSSNELILHRPNKDYNLLILKLNEEDLIFSNSIQSTTTVTNSEGVSSTQTQTVKQTLYMEDND